MSSQPRARLNPPGYDRNEPASPLETLSRLAVRGTYRTGQDGRGGEPLTAADLAHAASIACCGDFVGSRLAMLVATETPVNDDVGRNLVNALHLRALNGLSRATLKQVGPKSVAKLRLVVIDAIDTLRHQQRLSLPDRAKRLKMRTSDYNRLHAAAAAILSEAMHSSVADLQSSLRGE